MTNEMAFNTYWSYMIMSTAFIPRWPLILGIITFTNWMINNSLNQKVQVNQNMIVLSFYG
jgi:hypothetical protein